MAEAMQLIRLNAATQEWWDKETDDEPTTGKKKKPGKTAPKKAIKAPPRQEEKDINANETYRKDRSRRREQIVDLLAAYPL